MVAQGQALQATSRRRLEPMAAILPLLAGVLTATACADRSYAPATTSDLDSWKTWLAIASGVAAVAWVMIAVMALPKKPADGSQEQSVASGMLGDAFRVVAGSILALTVAGQFGDWLVRAVHEWGTVGDGLLVVTAAVSGLGGLGGIPVPALVLFGFVYPRPELLLLVTLPALAAQAVVYVVLLRAVVANRP